MLKFISTAVITLFLLQNLQAQGGLEPANIDKQPEVLSIQEEPVPYDIYMGLSTGINYAGLFGFTGEFNIYKNLTFSGAVGIGTWGYKFLGDLRLYKHYPQGIYYTAGIGYASGIPEIELEMETYAGDMHDYLLALNPVMNVDLGIGYAWKLGKRLRISLEIGYAIDVTDGDGFEVKGTYPELSDLSKETMKLMKPGGFRFGLGFNVGL
ncbi:MAG: hypothetical protein JXB00_19470 [Bacteroidales bacterium]|nr:hypothetical protein [Bacteroidales bacterium]